MDQGASVARWLVRTTSEIVTVLRVRGRETRSFLTIRQSIDVRCPVPVGGGSIHRECSRSRFLFLPHRVDRFKRGARAASGVLENSFFFDCGV